MYHVSNLATAHSYATETNALKALATEFGPADSGERGFNIILAHRPDGRVVIIAINIKDGGWMTRAVHSRSIGMVCN